MFVKICGITNREDALAAVDAGARALGFIFCESSPRHVTAEQIAAQLRLDIVQLHGAETPDRHPRGIPVWKAFRVNANQTQIPNYPAEAILIDGAAYDWSKTAHLTRPLILAGGLQPGNVREAIERTRRTREIWAVDVASGVEKSPGRKDHARMKQFIEAALHP